MKNSKRQAGADNCHSTHLRTSFLRDPPLTKKTLTENNIFATKMQDNITNLD